jgi:hypothetical protein
MLKRTTPHSESWHAYFGDFPSSLVLPTHVN